MEIAFQTGGIISDVLNFGLRAPIDIQVRGPSLDLIRPVAEAIQQRVAQVPQYGRCPDQTGQKLSGAAH